jgi:hypothetical protein
MPHGPEHHLEEAEHAQHAKHDPFDRRVAMTMAIVAATLACVTLLSHRAHNATLQNQIKANDNFTLASSRWAQYQAKVGRMSNYELELQWFPLVAKDPQASSAESSAVHLKKVQNKVDEWRKDMAEVKEIAEGYQKKSEEYIKASEHAHHQSDYFDLGELGVELSLVLCSVAVLSKRAGFWYSGIGVGIIGAAIALVGLFIH